MTLDNMSLTPAEFIGQGEKVITVGRFGATVKANGRPIDTATAHVFTIANGRIIRFLDFVNTAQIVDSYSGIDRD
jgi:ketosteroid isomerase-like protein